MSWFNKLFDSPDSPKPEPAVIKEPSAPHSDASIRWWRGFLKTVYTDMHTLQALGLPIPEQIGQLMHVEYPGFYPSSLYHLRWEKFNGGYWAYPTFTIPPHFVLTIDATNQKRFTLPSGEEDYFWEGILEKYIERYKDGREYRTAHTTWCIAGNAELVVQARATFEAEGAIAVISKFSGVWTNRDPYALYPIINRHDFLKEKENTVWGISISRLAPAPGYSAAALAERERKLSLFNSVMQGICQVQTSDPELYLSKWPDGAAKQYADEAPVLPEPELPTETVMLKILPSADTRPALGEEFLDSLRVAQSPLVFALDSNQQSQFFILTCSAHDRPLIERQLQNYFPDFGVVEYIDPPTPAELNVLNVGLEYQHQLLKPLSQFVVDPYRQLFNLLGVADQEQLRLEIIFAPVSPEISDYYSQQLETHRQSEDHKINQLASQRLKQWQKKQPMWSVAIRFVGTDRATLNHISESFLRQYETAPNTWKTVIETTSAPFLEENSPIAEQTALQDGAGEAIIEVGEELSSSLKDTDLATAISQEPIQESTESCDVVFDETSDDEPLPLPTLLADLRDLGHKFASVISRVKPAKKDNHNE